MKKLIFIIVVGCLILTSASYGQTNFPDYFNEPASKTFAYTQNNGQLTDMNKNLVNDIKFYKLSAALSVYLHDGGTFSYSVVKMDIDSITPDSIIKVNMNLGGESNRWSTPQQYNEVAGYQNFFFSHCPEGITNVKSYERIVYPEVYSNIDFHFFSNGRGIKNYFVIKKGGNPNNIEMNFDGHDNLDATSGYLKVIVGSDELIFPSAVAYQLDLNNNIVPLNWLPIFVKISASTVKIQTGAYDSSLPLIIQMGAPTAAQSHPQIDNLEWSSYYGGNINAQTRNTDVDSKGNYYQAGTSWAVNNFPVTPGAFSFVGYDYSDGVLAKFDANGVRKWATYFGSNNAEPVFMVGIDNNDSVFIAGETFGGSLSTNSLPWASTPPAGSYVDTIGGGDGNADLFVAQITTNGKSLLWSTYFGGPEFEYFYNIDIDNSNNIYLVGMGKNSSPLQYKAGAYNDASSGTSQSGETGMIVKFDNNLALNWATLFPLTASGFDCCTGINGIDHDAVGNLYIAGRAMGGLNTVNPGSGAYFISSLTNNTNQAFVAKFNTNDNLEWSTYFADSTSASFSEIINIKVYNNLLYVGGRTNDDNFPTLATGTAYTESFNGTGLNPKDDGFVARFNTNSHQLEWSTFIGGAEIDDVYSLALDNRGFLFISGSTKSNNINYFNAPNYYYENNNSGNTDAYIMAFKPDLTRIWATYYGGNRSDGSLLLKTFNNDKLYIGSTVNSVSPTYPLVDLGGQAWFDSVKVDTLGNAWILGRFDISNIGVLTTIDDQTSPENNSLIKVYPNPVVDIVTIDLSGLKQKSNISISLYGIDGKLIKEFNPKNVGTTYQISLEGLAKGSYILKIREEKNTQVVQFEKI
tara:strand:- start:25 stop:2601 length:2577 start_codon:yes stop_codon:yes gene_type:complete